MTGRTSTTSELWRGGAPGPVLLTNPELCPGAYSLHLYCRYNNPEHVYNEFPREIVAESGPKARARAKAIGWRIHPDRTATCPKCRKAGAA